jgi:hypothetical protein
MNEVPKAEDMQFSIMDAINYDFNTNKMDRKTIKKK